MKLFRNPELIKPVILYFVISLAAIIAAYSFDVRFGAFMFIICALFVFIFLFTTYMRYRRIAELSAEIDKILHGDSKISLEKFAEGELSILQSEIYKMTIRLREQQQRLKEDKIYLADSIADISHQIRTPLTSINIITGRLSEPNISKEQRLSLTRELFGLVSRIDWLINSLLKISKLDAGTVTFKKENISAEDFLSKATMPILIAMELREQNLIINAAGNLTCDIQWTSEAILNIVKNCMEHTPDKGTITIDAFENAIFTQIKVTDNGNGISKEDLPHIFERFYKGKDSDETSFGIGLFLARMIITEQEGTVKAENNKEKGAAFIIRFYKGVV